MHPRINNILYQLGLTANYAGFFQAAHAIHLAAENPERLVHITKEIYPEVAKVFHTSVHAVERNIRKVSDVAWEYSAQELSVLAHHALKTKPTAAQFIAILAENFFESGV